MSFVIEMTKTLSFFIVRLLLLNNVHEGMSYALANEPSELCPFPNIFLEVEKRHSGLFNTSILYYIKRSSIKNWKNKIKYCRKR